MRKRRYSITEEESNVIRAALRYLVIREPVTKETPLETVALLSKAEKLYIDLMNYQWNVE